MSLRFGNTTTPAWKIALIPVLLVVLFKVVRPTATDSAVTEARTSVEPEAPLASPSTRPASVLPELSLNEALAFDPFSRLAVPVRVVETSPEVPAEPVIEVAPKPPEPKPVVDRVTPLKQLKVSAVFPSSKGSMAIIDSKTVRVGDLLSPGVRVVEIRGMDVILRVEDGEAAVIEAPAVTATR